MFMVFWQTLDGRCLFDSLRFDPLHHCSFVVVYLLLPWLRSLEGVTNAYVLNVCGLGKRRSVLVYMVRRLAGHELNKTKSWVAHGDAVHKAFRRTCHAVAAWTTSAAAYGLLCPCSARIAQAL